MRMVNVSHSVLGICTVVRASSGIDDCLVSSDERTAIIISVIVSTVITETNESTM